MSINKKSKSFCVRYYTSFVLFFSLSKEVEVEKVALLSPSGVKNRLS
jgi:hypothetical protein